MQFAGLGGYPQHPGFAGGQTPSGLAAPPLGFGHSQVPYGSQPRVSEQPRYGPPQTQTAAGVAPQAPIKGQQDVYGLLQRTLAQKDQEIARLKAEGEATARRLEQQLQEVRAALAAKTAHVKRLEAGSKTGPSMPKGPATRPPKEPALAPAEKRPVPAEPMNMSGSANMPQIPYTVVAPTDPIDVQLEATYNQTACAIQFKRINRGFYLFGETKVELDMVNHKLMARTEDGWNRGKFGPIERFMGAFEPMELKRKEDIARRRSGGRP